MWRSTAFDGTCGLHGRRRERLAAPVPDGRAQFRRHRARPPEVCAHYRPCRACARAYKDINRLALKLLEPGGVLFTYSCSGGISADLFHKIVASAGIDAGVDGYISERMGGAPDHPMTIQFPEGEYLKGLVVMQKAA
jgi:23S rRNA (cytosine1962-C5)-methyltransferase